MKDFLCQVEFSETGGVKKNIKFDIEEFSCYRLSFMQNEPARK